MGKRIAIPCDDFNLGTIVLKHGAHGDTYRGEVCLVEAACVATMCDPTLAKRYGAPSQFADDHPSISRVVRTYAIGLNDEWNDEDRQRLVKYVPLILGTKTTDEDEQTRAWLCCDWLARTYTPAWLRLAGLTEHAQALESLARIVDATTARSAQPALDRARSASAAARDAAWAAARDAARDKLQPTVIALQSSALELFDRLIAVGRVDTVAGDAAGGG